MEGCQYLVQFSTYRMGGIAYQVVDDEFKSYRYPCLQVVHMWHGVV
jgi:hypothetical protein